MKMQTHIHHYFFFNVFLSVVIELCIVSCIPHGPVSPDRKSIAYPATCIAPRAFRSGETLPIIIRVDNNYRDSLIHIAEKCTLHISSGTLTNSSVILKKGVGSIAGLIESDTSVTIYSDNPDCKRNITLITDQMRIDHSGTLSDEAAVWDTTADHCITGDFTIPSGSELIIREGTRILSESNSNILVNGVLRCQGTIEHPILFSSLTHSQPWGGIEFTDGTGHFEYCIFTNGGADQTRAFSHAQCQPVVHAVRSSLTIGNCFFTDNIGKALGSIESTVSVGESLITRCTTGGEFHYSLVNISGCHIIDIPNGNDQFTDNDNDGFYFFNHHPQLQDASLVTHSFLITGKDDAIDHNNARLSIEHCWIEDFIHEGLAASEGDTVSVFDTVIRKCEQGVEAGYGSPFVIVDHCVILENSVGLRFGDSYEIAALGHLTASNTIVFSNQNEIYSFDANSDSPIDSGISLSYCLVNDSTYTTSPFCISGTPEFDATYHLLEHSVGASSGSDNTPLGLIKE
jgi:hypothetical protein